jgi:hypothetical protein
MSLTIKTDDQIIITDSPEMCFSCVSDPGYGQTDIEVLLTLIDNEYILHRFIDVKLRVRSKLRESVINYINLAIPGRYIDIPKIVKAVEFQMGEIEIGKHDRL